jgi:peptidoglycan L-alanyl-D-glutamate endopeptidase CwlK
MENGQPNWNKVVPSEVVHVAEVLGFEWGGNWKSFKDYPHFQMTFGQTWQQLYQQSQH